MVFSFKELIEELEKNGSVNREGITALKRLNDIGVLNKLHSFTRADVIQLKEWINTVFVGTQLSEKTEIVVRFPAPNPDSLARLASPWVEQIRQYYFVKSQNPKEPLFTQNKAKAWIKKNALLPPKMRLSDLSQLRRVWIKDNDALTEDIRGLAKAAGWHEGDTLWHILTGEIPEASKYRIVERRHNYAGPYKADLLESTWFSIDIDARFLTYEVVFEAYKKARKHLKIGKKRIVSLEDEAFVGFVEQQKEGRTKTWTEFWEQVRKEWNTKTGRKWTSWNMPRLHYQRTKKRLEREEKRK